MHKGLSLGNFGNIRGVEPIIVEVVNCSKYKLRENVYHDNWDGGIDYHNLALYIPVRLFKDIQEKLTDIEKVILKTINQISRDVTNEGLQNVVILPKLQSNNGSGEQSKKMLSLRNKGNLVSNKFTTYLLVT